VSGDTVASAAVRRRQRLSIPKITLTSASKTIHDQFDLIHRHQTRLCGCRCDRLRLDLTYTIEAVDLKGMTVQNVSGSDERQLAHGTVREEFEFTPLEVSKGLFGDDE
jgi:hypothetical protein